jgi:hypothetical protein
MSLLFGQDAITNSEIQTLNELLKYYSDGSTRASWVMVGSLSGCLKRQGHRSTHPCAHQGDVIYKKGTQLNNHRQNSAPVPSA